MSEDEPCCAYCGRSGERVIGNHYCRERRDWERRLFERMAESSRMARARDE